MFTGQQGRVFVNRGGVYGAPVDELPAEAPAPLGPGARVWPGETWI